MNFIISGKNIDVTPGLKDAIEQKLGKLERYFTPETEIIVTLSVEKAVPVHIAICLGGHIPAAQTPVHQILGQHLQAGKHRHAQEHTQHAAEAAANQNGHHHPEAGDARGVAQDLGAQDVAVKLLQDDDEDHEEQALLGWR